FPCPKCPSVFSRKNNLYYHAKFECGQSPRFNCPYCTYRTKHVSNVRAHVRRKHPGNKVYAIDVCKE
ncbi:LOLA3 protein, partial [Acromyrmex heyeri]